MSTARQIKVTISSEMAEIIEQKVASGEYASEADVLREGLRSLFARDGTIEDWLRTEVISAFDLSVSQPATVMSAQDAKARLDAHQRQYVDNK
jgi:putative addiction module CopG family antidote